MLAPLFIVLSTLTAVPSLARPEVPSAWLAELPAGLSQVQEAAALEVHGCRVSIGTALELPPFPPLHHVWMRKEGCETGGSVLLGTSYSFPSVLLDGSKHGLVATFTFRSTPSGSAFQQAAVVSVDLDSGAITHQFTLAALPPFGSGLVQPTSLELRGNGTVVVRGTKNGVMPGETGAGDDFVAVFEKFLKSELFSPPPSSVTAF